MPRDPAVNDFGIVLSTSLSSEDKVVSAANKALTPSIVLALYNIFTRIQAHFRTQIGKLLTNWDSVVIALSNVVEPSVSSRRYNISFKH